MRRIFLLLAVMVATSLPCIAGPREDLLAAYSRDDYTAAWALAKPLAQSGDEIAEYLTGKLLRDGNGTAKDNKEAVVWLRKAAEKGNSAAEDELGSVLAFDLEQKDEAKVWLQKAVDAKYPPAFRDMGWLIENGGSASALADAADFYRRGTELNDRDSQALYAKALLSGRGIPKDEKAAAQLYCQLNSHNSQRQCGLLMIAKAVPGVEPVEGLKLLTKLADDGDDESEIAVSDVYLGGVIVPKDVDEGLRRLKLAVAKDNMTAYFNMGWLSSQGIGMPKDRQAAFDWYKKASDKGLATAPRWMGDLLWDGISGKPDKTEAVRYYRLGVERGDDIASYKLAFALRFGEGVEKDELAAADIFCRLETFGGMYQCADMMLEEKTRKNDPDRAIALMRKANDQGSLDAEVALGYYFMNGTYVDKDLKEGLRLTKLAANDGSSVAMNNLGNWEESGTGVPKDLKLAMDWYKKAADAGNVKGLLSLGYLHYQKSSEVHDPAAAAQYFKQAADLGDADGKLHYGYALLNGDGVSKDEAAASDLFCALSTNIGRYECALTNINGKSRQKDKQRGFTELEKLSDEGFAKAQAEIGYYLFNGIDLKKNVAEGIRLTELAAEQNNSMATANIGYFYQVGLGSYQKNLSKAAASFEKAIDLDSSDSYSMIQLGKILEGSALGQPDLPRALSLYQRAADAGDTEAQKLAAGLIKRGVSPPFDALPPK